MINKLKKSKKIIHLYGASTKGNIILQSAKINSQDIKYASDRNPEKIGKLTPGSNIKIIDEKTSRKMNPDYYFVMPWHFKEEILIIEKIFLQKGGKIIFPLPKISIKSKH